MRGRRNNKNNLPKDPNEPVKPPKPYTRYSRAVWEQVQIDNPGMNIGQIGNTVGKMWRNLPEAEREVYNNEFQKEHIEYEKNMHQYRKSDEYQSWLAKSRAIPVNNASQIATDDSLLQSSSINQTMSAQTLLPISLPTYSYLEEEKDQSDEEQLEDKFASFYRYRRNQEYMYDLFMDSTCVNTNQDIHNIPEVNYEHEISRINQETETMSNYHDAKKLKISKNTELFRISLQEQISWLKGEMNKMKSDATSLAILKNLVNG